MRIGITYNLKGEGTSSAGPWVEDRDEELDRPETVEAIRKVLEEAGHQVSLLGGDLSIIEKIREQRIEFVFNIAEGFSGRSREAHIPSILEMMGIPYSGSDPLGLAATLDKSVAKRIAISLGIRTPEFWLVNDEADSGEFPERFPVFVKPAWQGSSKGIRLSSRVDNRMELAREISRLQQNYPGDAVMVEAYVPGREVTIGVIGNGRPEILGVMEITFRNQQRKDFCYSLETKRNWREEVEYQVPPTLDPMIEEGLRDSALRMFRALGLRDVARFDFRVNPQGEFYFLEVNPLPGLSPDSGDLVILARKKGWSYHQLILKITELALSRYR